MTYNELKQIAKPHIREGENLPSNSFLLLNQLHIPFRNEKQCEKDFSDTINPLTNNPAFLSIDAGGNKTIYFNSNTSYWNFYIFHEIAHYILGHEQNSPQNEIDADILACILAAPIENLPTYLKSARDLSTLCKIPIDKAEMYWQEIKSNFSKSKKKPFIIGTTLIIILSFLRITLGQNVNVPIQNNNIADTNIVNNMINPQTTIETKEYFYDSSEYYVTSSGRKYHEANCQYVKHKTNVISITIEEANDLSLEPCEKCIF